MFIYEKIKQIKSSFNFQYNDNLPNLIQKIKNINLYSIFETINNLNLLELENIINCIFTSKRIFVFGVGSSSVICSELNDSLIKLGFNSYTSQDFHGQLLFLNSFNDNDLLILFSKSGRTREILEILKNGIKYKIPITLVTSNLNCGYEKYLYNKIIFRTLEQLSRYSAVSSKITQLLFVDIIFNQIMERKKQFKKLILHGTHIIKNWNKINS
ncbi:SIS domain-containing protein [Spiroplasma endosymbiont of Seladonia tumulorum]|uniref:SIS domain-containing protein n=1 Tax=Spiroplasma endosymbiont of Seladonia tumulorum TaxID=3066321 RepID=UPI0030CB8EA0